MIGLVLYFGFTSNGFRVYKDRWQEFMIRDWRLFFGRYYRQGSDDAMINTVSRLQEVLQRRRGPPGPGRSEEQETARRQARSGSRDVSACRLFVRGFQVGVKQNLFDLGMRLKDKNGRELTQQMQRIEDGKLLYSGLVLSPQLAVERYKTYAQTFIMDQSFPVHRAGETTCFKALPVLDCDSQRFIDFATLRRTATDAKTLGSKLENMPMFVVADMVAELGSYRKKFTTTQLGGIKIPSTLTGLRELKRDGLVDLFSQARSQLKTRNVDFSAVHDVVNTSQGAATAVPRTDLSSWPLVGDKDLVAHPLIEFDQTLLDRYTTSTANLDLTPLLDPAAAAAAAGGVDDGDGAAAADEEGSPSIQGGAARILALLNQGNVSLRGPGAGSG